MIDRVYLFALAILLFLLQRDLFIIVGGPLLLIVLVASIPLFLFEGLANFLSPKLQRQLITFRYKPKRAIPRLILHLGLDRPRSPAELTEKAQALAKAARTVTLRHPNPIYGPVRLDRLSRSLDAVLMPANKPFLRKLQKAWTGPSPSASLGGLVLALRARLGKLIFGKWIDIARTQSIAGAASAIATISLPKPEQPWMSPDYPGQMVFFAWKALAEANGLTTFKAEPAWLPLSAQRKLAAITAQVYGTSTEARLARLLNPSSSAMLAKVAADHAKWQPWSVAQQKATTAQTAAHATMQKARQTYQAEDSLTQAEITDLIADRAQDSILLNRLWPPGTPAPGNSWLGGLPCLPPEMDWPRSPESDLPLHFLAQVDCADLPTLGGTSLLPRDGLLLFFSDLDEERVLGDGMSTTSAVVHVPKARQSDLRRALPADLPEINHTSGKPGDSSDGTRSYPKWPLAPVAVKIWGGEEDGRPRTANRDYQLQSRSAHDASLAAVMPPPAKDARMADLFPRGLRKDAIGRPVLGADGKAAYDTRFDPNALPQGFPWCGAGSEVFLDRLQQSARAETLAKLAADARKVMGRIPPQAPVPPATLEALHRWLETLATDSPNLCWVVQRAVSDTILTLTRAAVTDAALMAQLPPIAFALHAHWLVPNPKQSQHLMLGPAQVKTNSTAGSGVRLLCLDSDYGPGMMFCDCGVLEYWIDAQDLAALRFDRATAQTAGG